MQCAFRPARAPCVCAAAFQGAPGASSQRYSDARSPPQPRRQQQPLRQAEGMVSAGQAACSSSSSSTGSSSTPALRQQFARPKRSKRRTGTLPMHAVTAALNDATSLSTVQDLVQNHSHRLDHTHISTILRKLVSFKHSDEVLWYAPAAQAAEQLQLRQLEDRRRAQALRRSRLYSDIDGTVWHEASLNHVSEAADESSEEEEEAQDQSASAYSAIRSLSSFDDPADGSAGTYAAYRSPYQSADTIQDEERRYSAFAASTSAFGSTLPRTSGRKARRVAQEALLVTPRDVALAREEASQQLRVLLKRVVQLSCDRAMQFDLYSAATALEALVHLGYSDQSRVRALLEATQPLVRQLRATAVAGAGASTGAGAGAGATGLEATGEGMSFNGLPSQAGYEEAPEALSGDMGLPEYNGSSNGSTNGKHPPPQASPGQDVPANGQAGAMLALPAQQQAYADANPGSVTLPATLPDAAPGAVALIDTAAGCSAQDVSADPAPLSSLVTTAQLAIPTTMPTPPSSDASTPTTEAQALLAPAAAPLASSALQSAQPSKAQLKRQKQRLRRQEAASATATSSSGRLLVSLVWSCSELKLSPPSGWLKDVEGASQACLIHMSLHELAALVEGLADMGHRVGFTWLTQAEAISAPLLPASQPAHAARLLAGFWRMRHRPDDAWMHAFLASIAPSLSSLSSQQLTDVVSVLSRMYCKPSDSWMAAYYAAVDALPLVPLPQQQPQQPQQLGQQPGQQQQQLQQRGARQVQRRQQRQQQWQQRWSWPGASSSMGVAGSGAAVGSVLTAEQLTSLVAALARLGCRPDGAWLNDCLLRSRRCLSCADAAQLSQLIQSLATLRFRASEAWLQNYLTAAYARLPYATPQECCTIIISLSKLGHQPQGLWLQELAGRVRGRLSLFSSKQLADLACSLARFSFRPDDEWLLEFERCSGGKLKQSSSDELAAFAWALAEMGHRPEASWLYSYVLAAYQQLDSFSPTQLGTVFEALPAITPYPRWPDELVQICASEKAAARLNGKASVLNGKGALVL